MAQQVTLWKDKFGTFHETKEEAEQSELSGDINKFLLQLKEVYQADFNYESERRDSILGIVEGYLPDLNNYFNNKRRQQCK